MLRMFCEHQRREAASLCRRWDFVTAKDIKVSGKQLPRRYTRTIQVPSCWEQLPGLETYRGKAWLRTQFRAEEGKATRLVFGGVSHTATVYVDGKKVGGHYDAYTCWDVVLPKLKAGMHELVVEVDNSFGPDSLLHRESDFYTYGGITRPVEIQYVPQLYIDKIFATPSKGRNGKWKLAVTVTVKNCGKDTASGRMSVEVAGQELELGRVSAKAGATAKVKGELTGLTVKPWDEHNPNLYFVTARLTDGEVVIDDLIDRVGFREVKVQGKKILLNGKSIRLRGFNRHEDHPAFGCALPVQAMANDLEIMRDLNCNFIRTSHYPNDTRFIDLCDEMGFYVWEDPHFRNVPIDHPLLKPQYGRNMEEMVEWHFNRPSIVMWGCLNETFADTAFGKKIHKWALDKLRKLDGSRPVTYASFKHQYDISLQHTDIVSWNRYDAWYVGGPEEVLIRIRRHLKWLHSNQSKGGKGKPLIMSEFGGGGIYGYRMPHRAKWTEEYQVDVLDESLRVYLGTDDIVGVAIWQFCDCRITTGGTLWEKRPRTMNNKGVVDEWRRPKLAYEAVKKRMAEDIKRRKRR